MAEALRAERAAALSSASGRALLRDAVRGWIRIRLHLHFVRAHDVV